MDEFSAPPRLQQNHHDYANNNNNNNNNNAQQNSSARQQNSQPKNTKSSKDDNHTNFSSSDIMAIADQLMASQNSTSTVCRDSAAGAAPHSSNNFAGVNFSNLRGAGSDSTASAGLVQGLTNVLTAVGGRTQNTCNTSSGAIASSPNADHNNNNNNVSQDQALDLIRYLLQELGLSETLNTMSSGSTQVGERSNSMNYNPSNPANYSGSVDSRGTGGAGGRMQPNINNVGGTQSQGYSPDTQSFGRNDQHYQKSFQQSNRMSGNYGMPSQQHTVPMPSQQHGGGMGNQQRNGGMPSQQEPSQYNNASRGLTAPTVHSRYGAAGKSGPNGVGSGEQYHATGAANINIATYRPRAANPNHYNMNRNQYAHEPARGARSSTGNQVGAYDRPSNFPSSDFNNHMLGGKGSSKGSGNQNSGPSRDGI